jgi:dUTPase
VIMAVEEASFAMVTHEGLGGASRGSGGFGHTGT